jgi:ribosomal-protein-alanine N-acetyltransferase
MEEEDLPAVLAIEKLCFPKPWQESTFRGEIQNRPISSAYVVISDGEKRVVGYIIFWQIRDEVQINNIAVHPDFRGRGIGEAVLRHVLDEVKRNNAKIVTLEVRPSNLAAFSLYQKLGFRILGLRKNYYASPAEDALVLGLQFN